MGRINAPPGSNLRPLLWYSVRMSMGFCFVGLKRWGKRLFSVILLLLWGIGTGLEANTYRLNVGQSKSSFKVYHIRDKTVTGEMRPISGLIEWHPNDLTLSKVTGSIPLKSLSTGSKIRDRHLLSKEFFHSKAHPRITFQSQQIQKTKTGYLAIGILDMHGVKKKISIPFQDKSTLKGLVFSAEITLNRHDFEISAFKRLIRPDVMISLSALATPVR